MADEELPEHKLSTDEIEDDADGVQTNGSRDGSFPKESWFDTLVRELNESATKTIDKSKIEQCFEYFKSCPQENISNQGLIEGLTFEDFVRLMNELFVDYSAIKSLNDGSDSATLKERSDSNDGSEIMVRGFKSFYIPKSYYIELFQKFDRNRDNVIDKREFNAMWGKWIQIILRPKSAFIIVDVQNDFINGSLAISKCPAGHKGEEVVPVVNRLLAEVPFDLVVYSYDWHPHDHISFIENYRKRKIIARNGIPLDDDEQPTDVQVFEEVTFEGPPQTDQKLWPRHCVQGSWGAKLHPDVTQVKDESKYININKGTKSNIDSYSAFWDNNKLSETGLGTALKDRGITDVYVCGLAYDVCVGATSGHAIEYGFRTTLINDASRGVDMKAIAQTKNNLINKSAVVIDSDRIRDMVLARERRPEHAYHMAQFIK